MSGQYRSLTCSAMGRVLLSLKPDAEVLAWARRCNVEALEERFKVREADFLKLIHQVRADGYAMTEGDVTPGSAPSPSRSPRRWRDALALGVGGPIARVRRKRGLILDALASFVGSFEDRSGAKSAETGGV